MLCIKINRLTGENTQVCSQLFIASWISSLVVFLIPQKFWLSSLFHRAQCCVTLDYEMLILIFVNSCIKQMSSPTNEMKHLPFVRCFLMCFRSGRLGYSNTSLPISKHSWGIVPKSISCLPLAAGSDLSPWTRNVKNGNKQNTENNNTEPVSPSCSAFCVSKASGGGAIMIPLREWRCLGFFQCRVQVVFLNNTLNYWWQRDWME